MVAAVARALPDSGSQAGGRGDAAGYLIAWDEERFDSREGAAPELADIWRGFVLPRVVVR